MQNVLRGPDFRDDKEHGIIAMFFIAVFGIMPFAYTVNLFDPVEVPSLMAGLLIVSIFAVVSHNRCLYRLTKIDLLWIIYIFAYLQSISVCKDSANALFETIKCIFAYLLFITYRITVKDERAAVIAGLVVSVVAAIQAGIVIAQKYIGVDIFNSSSKFFGTMTNKNILAEFALFSFPLIVFCLLKIKPENNNERIIAVAGLASALFLVVTLKSRSVWVGFCGAAFVVLAILLKYKRKQFTESVTLHKNEIKTAAVCLIVSFSVYLVVDYKDFVKHIIDLLQGNSEGRITIWLKTLPIIYDNFWQGVGAGNFRYYLGKMEGEFKTRPHNDYLWVLSETGILGVVVFIALIGVAVYVAYRNIQNNKGHLLAIQYAALFFLVAYSIDSFFAFPKERPYNLVYFAFFVAVPFTCTIVSESKPLLKIGFITRIVCVVAVSITALIFCFYRYDAETKLKKVIHGARMQPSERLQVLQSIKTWVYKADPLSVPVNYYHGLALLETGNYIEAKSRFILASELYPFQPDVLLSTGTVCELTGDRLNAKSYYSRAIAADTHDYRPVLNLAILEYKDKQFAKCAEQLLKLDTIALRKDTLQYRQYRVLKNSISSYQQKK
jgi:O-antigen ligase